MRKSSLMPKHFCKQRAQKAASMCKSPAINNKLTNPLNFYLQSRYFSYEHLSKLLTRILSERPSNAADIFEDLSKQQKFERFVSQADTLIEKPEKSSENKLAEVQKYLFMVIFRNFQKLSNKIHFKFFLEHFLNIF